jgi:hypothetical protein
MLVSISKDELAAAGRFCKAAIAHIAARKKQVRANAVPLSILWVLSPALPAPSLDPLTE